MIPLLILVGFLTGGKGSGGGGTLPPLNPKPVRDVRLGPTRDPGDPVPDFKVLFETKSAPKPLPPPPIPEIPRITYKPRPKVDFKALYTTKSAPRTVYSRTQDPRTSSLSARFTQFL